MTDNKRPPHPGKTEAQRKILDAIGCGDFSPSMTGKTRIALEKAGLIEFGGYKVLGKGRFGEFKIPQYQMPTAVHMQWCKAVATDEDSDDHLAE